MPLDFPNDPAVGDIFAGAGARWQWDGAKWTSLMTGGGPFLPLTGGELSGPLMLAADPAVALHAATKQYVDAGGSGYLPLTGGALSGPLMLAAVSTATPPAGVGLLQGHAVNGTVIQGSGSTTDFMLNNKNGAAVLWVPTGTAGANMNTIATGSVTARSLADRFADAINVRDYGAKGDGVTDDTAAIQAAVTAGAGGAAYFPRGTYLTSTPIRISSNMRIFGAGAGSTITASATWVNPGLYGTDPYMFFTNVNYQAVPTIDQNIVIEGLQFNWTHQSTGASHSIRFVCANNIIVRDCIFQNGGDATAMVACSNTLVTGCSSFGALNCPFDHWGGTSNARVIGNYAAASQSGIQLVNFNASVGTLSLSTPAVSDGCVIADNQFVYTGSATSAILISALGTPGNGNAVKNVIISNNKIVGHCIIQGTGDVENVSIIGNIISGTSTNAVISMGSDGVNAPQAVTVSGNTIINPQTASGNLGVIRLTSVAGFSVFGNTITGSGFYFACWTVGSTAGAIGTNNFATGTAGIINGSTSWITLSGNVRFANGDGAEWYDTGRNLVQLLLQTDNNLVWKGTGSTGAVRVMLSCQQLSDTSQFGIGPTVGLATNADNQVAVTGASTGGGPLIQPQGIDTNISLRVLGVGTSGIRLGAYTPAGTPTTTTLPAGQWTVWKDTSGGTVKLYYNDGGTLKSVALT